jgi:hypothetical protein
MDTVEEPDTVTELTASSDEVVTLGRFALRPEVALEPAEPPASSAAPDTAPTPPDDAESAEPSHRKRLGIVGGIAWALRRIPGSVGAWEVCRGAVDDVAGLVLTLSGAVHDVLSVGRGARAMVEWPACLHKMRDADEDAGTEDVCAKTAVTLRMGQAAALVLLAAGAALCVGLVPALLWLAAQGAATGRLVALAYGSQPPDSLFAPHVSGEEPVSGDDAPAETGLASGRIALLADPDPSGLALVTAEGGSFGGSGVASEAAMASLLWSVAVRTHASLQLPSARHEHDLMNAAVDRLRRRAARMAKAQAAGKHLKAAAVATVAAVNRFKLPWPPDGLGEEDAKMLLDAATVGLRHARFFETADDPLQVRKIVAELLQRDPGNQPSMTELPQR